MSAKISLFHYLSIHSVMLHGPRSKFNNLQACSQHKANSADMPLAS
jgi:hypothetical protein